MTGVRGVVVSVGVLLDRFRNPRAAITLVFALNGALYGSWASRIPAIQNRLDLSAGALGIALAGVATGALVAMPLSGGWAARAGSRRATRTLLAAACIAVPLASFAPSLPLLVLGTLALGAANGGLDVAMNAQGAAVERRAGKLIFSSLQRASASAGSSGRSPARPPPPRTSTSGSTCSSSVRSRSPSASP